MSGVSKDSSNITNSEIVEDSEKRQYHIGLSPGEVANTVLLVGDPARAEKVAKHFDSVTIQKVNREFITFTGTYKGQPLSVMSTGIGPSNIEIAVIELSRIFSEGSEVPTLIRIGSCGSLQEDISVGDLVISTGAVRLEDTSTYFVDESYPAVANYEVITALTTSTERNKFTYHVGITATGSGFYGAQGRESEKFPIRNPHLQDRLAKLNVLNFEMESSALFTLASLAKFRAGTVCAVYANRPKKTFIDQETKKQAEKNAIKSGLDAALILRSMDKQKQTKKVKYWNSDLSISEK